MPPKLDYPLIEIRGFKWLKRPTAVAGGFLLGDDQFGRWLGISRGDPWWTADSSRTGVFVESFVKLVPQDTYWTACFNPGDPVVDVDIAMPVQWTGNILEEIDLELDVLRLSDGTVHVRDQDEFARMRTEWGLPNDVAVEAESTCSRLLAQVRQSAEPFGTAGPKWLARFLAEVTVANPAAAKFRD